MRLRERASKREAVGVSPATPWLFVAPATLLIVATILTPIVMSGWISLHSWSMLTPITAMQWVGVDNYAAIFRDPSFLRALTNTAVFAAAFVLLGVPLALVMAVLITPVTGPWRPHRAGAAVHDVRHPHGRGRAAVGLPALAAWRPGQRAAQDRGAAHPAVARDPRTALWSLVLLTLWQNLGYFTTILVAGLTQIPREYDEAAEIDGAGPIRRLFAITIPLLRRPLTFAMAICLINGLGAFDAVNVLTKGGPSDSTNVVTLHAVRTAFDYGSAGRAAAMTMVLLVGVVVAVGGVLLMSRDLQD